jgi:hypothetical protein
MSLLSIEHIHASNHRPRHSEISLSISKKHFPQILFSYEKYRFETRVFQSFDRDNICDVDDPQI